MLKKHFTNKQFTLQYSISQRLNDVFSMFCAVESITSTYVKSFDILIILKNEQLDNSINYFNSPVKIFLDLYMERTISLMYLKM